ncbi:MAG: uroporphyrinogen-III synthase [Paracoccaceae bacterium]
MDTQSHLLLTRPRPRSEAFAAELERALPGRFRCTIAPLIEIEPVAAAIDANGAQGLIFTSATAVRLAAGNAALHRLPCICVGPATASCARAEGFRALSADGGAGDVLRLAIATFRPGAGRILHCRGQHAAGDLAAGLAAAGLPVETVILYDQKALPLNAAARRDLRDGRIDIVTFFSPRTAAIFRQQSESDWKISQTVAVCLSPAVAEKLKNLRFKAVCTAKRPNSGALVALLGEISR